ncbi:MULTISPECIES: peptidoglycan D,D-transpeptidase FtsI family protein [unclassified Clostridioides]|uniref:peptidoglycan D,D-transpeptidase FtsI family protein n=1 Tax=unclassified Clostridioides TaxID=2635829 RepID=UPI001D10BE85|nr:penicillin-binding protein 2 [Clostridioides sp. ZZV14-6150]MCC0659760.1 penicillin-binding protein 2 [Clostridioides sp. ZZV14-6154]MCC0664652.1 penicillin-binding protein 2 [Clostridioides sp. ZZV15-6597]MCC0717747.1 penicillin-binding protein 2 [Clostridioides sp. ZZV14-6105]MCC0722684.1 penicillin-binding protein 2 [Clostridioides sp. ZZV14-6104]MCC0729187.1 penicillin-binding protein 2 [Clostridioides sp. ZZV14-6048]MCC0734063.1 penicillin-binding protein 2 [Clostridioides sp. ZZV14-6
MSKKKTPFLKKVGKRSWYIFTVILIIYSGLIYRLVDIQVLKGDKYKRNVESQSVEKVELNSGRGIIYDRNNKKLTDTSKVQLLVVEKEKLNNNYKILELVKKATKMDDLEIYKIIQEQLANPIIQIQTENIDNSMKKQLEKNGIMLEEKTMRYSQDGLLSHTIGYIKDDDKSGQLGIEKSMDSVLRNSNEKYISAFKAGDAGNEKSLNILKGSVKTVDEKDKDKHLKTTIDYDIQKNLEQILNKEENPTAAVISDVSTGEIIAMCSRPNFDQNNIAKSLKSKNGEFENRVIKSTYPPGSVFKMVVLFSALENGVVDENYTYNCKGKTKVGNSNEILRCNKLDGHGLQSLQQTFSNSCNPAFLDIAMKVGKEKILKSAEKLHLFEKVDIGLDEERIREAPKNISIRNLAIGQENIEFTPLQINQMTQIIANNGTFEPLYLYKSLVNNDMKTIKTYKSSKKEEIISPYVCTQVKEIMKSVSKVGTAKVLKDLEGGCGVKTGTAQSSLNKKPIDHGWITGFYPEKRPKYVITVLVEGTQKESKSAIPIFKEICESIK